MLRLFLIFFVVMFLEIWVWRLAAPFISWGIIIIATVAAVFYGISQIRKGIMRMQQAALAQSQSGLFRTQADALKGMGQGSSLQALAVVVSGILWIIPGFISDVFALLVLLAPVQKVLGKWIQATIIKNQQAILERMAQMQSKQGGATMGGMGGMGGFGSFGGGPGPTAGSGRQQNPFGQSAGGNPFEDLFKQAYGNSANDNVIDGEATDVTEPTERITDQRRDRARPKFKDVTPGDGD